MHRVLVPLAAVVLVACSSSNQPSFAVTAASVDPTYYCPGGANNAPYDLHATLKLHNGTASAVTIKAVTAQMTVAASKGAWLEKVGDRYDAGNARFAPGTVAAGHDATLDVTIPSACTSGKYGTGTSSSADYAVTIDLATSAGKFTITAANQHEIVAD
jgi:hypothetical protein